MTAPLALRMELATLYRAAVEGRPMTGELRCRLQKGLLASMAVFYGRDPGPVPALTTPAAAVNALIGGLVGAGAAHADIVDWVNAALERAARPGGGR